MSKAQKTAAPAYDGPPDYRVVGQHGMFPEVNHDEAERFNFLAHLNRHLAANVMPNVHAAFETRVEPQFKKEQKRDFKDRHEVRHALAEDRMFQVWSAMRRNAMEMRQQAGRWVTIRQADDLKAKADKLIDAHTLKLNAKTKLPRYVSAVDHHCMPGSYHTELFDGDVTGAANYDIGLFATTGGMLGRFNDGGGKAVVDWVKTTLPDFKPKRILDIGATLGHNAVPIAQAFPDAQVTAIDVGAPMLRYGAARAKSLGVDNIEFVQADAEDLSQFDDESFDWVQTTMFLHETSLKGMTQIMREAYRVLKPGGIIVHVEQPQYTDDMPLYEQAMRDWDAFYNNEPFWSKLHEMDIDKVLTDAGFSKDKLIHSHATAEVDKDVFPDAADDDVEDFGRKAAWEVIGATK